MFKKFPVRVNSNYLTVSHHSLFVASSKVIVVYELNGTPICSFGEGTLSDIRNIAAGSDGQIFVLNFKRNLKEKIAYVFTNTTTLESTARKMIIPVWPVIDRVNISSSLELNVKQED